MKKVLLFALVLAAAYFGGIETGIVPGGPDDVVQSQSVDNLDLEAAFRNRQSDIQIRGSGRVIRVLRDDMEGSRHQRFILDVGSGQTLLIAHNIDLAERISSLKTGDRIEFFGEYEWNPQGGVLHWTHLDPQKRHLSGWLKHNGNIYQ